MDAVEEVGAVGVGFVRAFLEADGGVVDVAAELDVLVGYVGVGLEHVLDAEGDADCLLSL